MSLQPNLTPTPILPKTNPNYCIPTTNAPSSTATIRYTWCASVAATRATNLVFASQIVPLQQFSQSRRLIDGANQTTEYDGLFDACRPAHVPPALGYLSRCIRNGMTRGSQVTRLALWLGLARVRATSSRDGCTPRYLAWLKVAVSTGLTRGFSRCYTRGF